jgi:hypothetical protein
MGKDVVAGAAHFSAQTECVKPSPKHNDGAICVRWVRCGKSWCRCMQGGPRHGPYFARYWWKNGRRYKHYVRQQDAVTLSELCVERRTAERQQREQAEATRQSWRNVRALLREIEHDG